MPEHEHGTSTSKSRLLHVAADADTLVAPGMSARDGSASIVSTVAPSATDDAPETDDDDPGPPVWTEEWLECCAVAGPGAPGNLAPLAEIVLHYLSGTGAAEDVLGLGVQTPKPDDADQKLAKHLLDGFRGVLRKHMIAVARS